MWLRGLEEADEVNNRTEKARGETITVSHDTRMMGYHVKYLWQVEANAQLSHSATPGIEDLDPKRWERNLSKKNLEKPELIQEPPSRRLQVNTLKNTFCLPCSVCLAFTIPTAGDMLLS